MLVQQLYPTPFQFAAHFDVYRRLKRTAASWETVLRYANQPVDPAAKFFHYNPIPEDPWKWPEGAAQVEPQTLEGIALHALITIHCGRTESEVEDAKQIFLNLRHHHGTKWGLIDIGTTLQAA